MFIDYAKIQVIAGKGGNGCSSLHREKFKPKGGPDGGNGGVGGNVYFVGDKNYNNLYYFKENKKFQAESGQSGMRRNKTGKNGDNIYIKVPIGTVIKESETFKVLADITEHGQKFLAAKGGRYGRGNAMFKSATNQAPDYAELGLPGEEKILVLELKIIADIGLIGFPNAGKSTLLSVISAARPKIADYPFTTLEPNLGVVYVDSEHSYTAADIPGLIENAHKGSGLGTKFLRHIERTKIFVHLIDGTSDNIKNSFNIINNELKSYSDKLILKKQIVAVTKMDICNLDESEKKELTEYFKNSDFVSSVLFISSASNTGIQQLKYEIKNLIQEYIENEPEQIVEPVKTEYSLDEESDIIKIEKLDNGIFNITGRRIEKLVERINIGTYDGLNKFNSILKRFNINMLLKNAGAQNHDLVTIKDKEFEYFDDDRKF